MPYPFLSDEWLDAIGALVLEHRDAIPADTDLVVNLEVVETPFASDRRVHVGAREGEPRWGRDFSAEADVTLSCDYATATTIFLSGDPSAGITAFVAGKVRIQGDVSKLIVGGSMAGLPLAAPELAAKVIELTEPPEPPREA